LFCYLKNRKCKGPECGYDQPLSQEGYEFDVYENGEYGPFARRMTSDPQSPLRPSELTDILSALRASDLTQMSDIATLRQNGGLDDFLLLNRPGASIEVGVMPPPPPPRVEAVTPAVTKYLLTPEQADALLRVTR
jgi:hypothetical protein